MKTRMKPRLFAGVLTLVLIIFTAGFYLGGTHLLQNPNNANTILPFGGEREEGSDVDLSTFWEVWEVLNEKFVSSSGEDTVSATDQERVYGAIEGMVDSLGDPYTVFLPPQESQIFQDNIEGLFGGVGMMVGIRDSVLTVISPLEGTPADQAGIEPEDKIVAINGSSTQDMSVTQAVSEIRGEIGTNVTLTLLRENRVEPFDVDVTRSEIEIPTIDTTLRDDNIFVIELYNFSAQSPELVRDALTEFVQSGSDKLIIDLRGNAGGFLEAAVSVSSWFLPAGEVIVREDYGDKRDPRIHRSKGYDIFADEDVEVVVLVNGGSASAAEIVAGALSEHGAATLIGTQTFGKGSVQELVELTPETSLKVTIARWLTPERHSISENGIQPDIIVEPTDEDREQGRDVQLQRAVEYLHNQ